MKAVRLHIKRRLYLIRSKVKESWRRTPKGTKVTIVIGAIIFSALVIITIMPWLFSPYSPLTMSSDILSPPSYTHLLGTDVLGRDLLSRIFYGASNSLSVAFVSILISGSIGVPAGILSGYYGGKLDKVVSIPLDALYSFPTIVFALLISFMLGPGIIQTAIAVAVAWAPTFFRVTRSLVLPIKESMYIEAERAIGASESHILLRYVLPQCMPSIVVLITLNLSYAIITIASLGFLGLGIPPPSPEWGTDLSLGRGVLLNGAWWPSFFPGIMISLAALSFNLLGEGFNVMISPRLRVR